MFVNILVHVNVYVVLYDVNKAKTHSVPRYRPLLNRSHSSTVVTQLSTTHCSNEFVCMLSALKVHLNNVKCLWSRMSKRCLKKFQNNFSS